MFFIFRGTNLSVKTFMLRGFTKCRLVDYSIPYSFYNLDSYNNTFILNEGADVLVTIPVGDYTITITHYRQRPKFQLFDLNISWWYYMMVYQIKIA